MLVIGTSHGLILGFDSSQALRWCDQEARHQGSVSALCFNHEGSRVLAGFVRGHILMLDSSNGKVLRVLTDVHPLDTAVLHVKVCTVSSVSLVRFKMAHIRLFDSIKPAVLVYRFTKGSSVQRQRRIGVRIELH